MAPPHSPPLDDATVVELAHANDVEFAREMARWSGRWGELVERDGYLLFATGSDFPVLANGAIRLDPTTPAEAVIDAADAWFAERERGWSLSACSWQGRDDDLAAVAADRGLLAVTDAPAMVCADRLPDPDVPEGVEVRWATTRSDIEAVAALNDEAYQSLGMPPGVIIDQFRAPERVLAPWIRTAVVTVDGVASATAQILLSHGVAGVYYVGTLEAARGRGLAALVTTVVTNEAFDRGAALVTLQASSMGEPIYRRLGYREAYRYVTHARFR